MRFIVIVAMYNMADLISSNIEMLKKQTHKDFRCLIGDDLSTDNSVEIVRDLIRDDPRFSLVVHDSKKFSMGNIYSLIELARPNDEDVLVLVDGDDRLAHEKVLEKLHKIYRQQDCWMTYGSYSNGGTIPEAICTPYPESTVNKNRYRDVKWRASHLKTFKYKLWARVDRSAFTITEAEFEQAKRRAMLQGRLRTWWHWRKINYSSLVNPTKEFIRRCDDKAMTLPMLEMAGEKALFVKDIFYHYVTYPKELDFDRKTIHQKWYTRCIRNIIEHKPRYNRLTESTHPDLGEVLLEEQSTT
jgi:glycosyltransferase involved in cell wall biosynthesis